MAGLFDDIETPVDEIPSGYGIPNDTYEVAVTGVSTRVQSREGEDDQTKILIEFTVQEGDYEGSKHTVWLTKPDGNNPKTDKNGKLLWKTQASVLKGWLKALGIPDSEIGNFDPETDEDAVVGNTGTLKLTPQKDNPQYQNASFNLDDDLVPSGASDKSLKSDGNVDVDLAKF